MLYEPFNIDGDKICTVAEIRHFRIAHGQNEFNVYKYTIEVNYLTLPVEYQFQDFWIYRYTNGDWVDGLDNHSLCYKIKDRISHQETGNFRQYVKEYVDRA